MAGVHAVRQVESEFEAGGAGAVSAPPPALAAPQAPAAAGGSRAAAQPPAEQLIEAGHNTEVLDAAGDAASERRRSASRDRARHDATEL
jgi:hypothetical protein